MPWVQTLPSGKYRACWRDDLGKPKSKAPFTQEAAALRYAGEQESKSRRGEVTAAGRSPKWGDWCDEWLELRRVEAATRGDDESRIANYLRPQWGNAQIGRVTREHVQKWVNDLTRAGHSPDIVRRVYYTFSASMKAAMLGGRIPINPCSHVKLPEPSPAPERYFTHEEITRATSPEYFPDRTHRDAVITDVGTGQRPAELIGLHWNRVDFKRRIITVAEVFEPDLDIIRPYPKSKKPRYLDAVPSWVWSVLEARYEDFGPGDGCGMPHGDSRRPCRSGLVFTRRDGEHMDGQGLLRRHWRPAQKRAGIDPIGTVKDLRHTFASWLVQSGVPLQEVQRLMGHASILTTQRYAHLGDTQNAAVLRALENQGGGRLLTLAASVPHEDVTTRDQQAI